MGQLDAMNEQGRDDEILKKISLFSALTDEQFAHVKQTMRVINLEENLSLFDTETCADRFFVLTDGQIKLYRTSYNGSEKIVEIIRPGEAFASAVIFMKNNKYPVCADTLQASRILSFDNKQFFKILHESPETCFRMMAHMSQQLRWQLSEIYKLSLQSAPSRLVSYLLENMKPLGNNKGMVKLDASKRTIASRITIQPETFSRALKKLSNEGLVTVKGQSIHINDVEALTTIHAVASE